MNNNRSFIITVCIATYNGERFIDEQLHSILHQITNKDQIIISDDLSSDSTLEIIRNLKDPRITIFSNTTQHGPVNNFENALRHATGDIIFLADQDDIWMPNKVATMLNYLENADIVMSDCQIIDENGTILFPSFFERNGSKLGIMNNLFKNSYIGCCMAFNRKILAKALPFPSDIPMHDWWIGLIGEAYGKSIVCNQQLVAYRRHTKNVSASGEKSPYNLFRKVRFRYIMIKNLIKRCIFNE